MSERETTGMRLELRMEGLVGVCEFGDDTYALGLDQRADLVAEEARYLFLKLNGQAPPLPVTADAIVARDQYASLRCIRCHEIMAPPWAGPRCKDGQRHQVKEAPALGGGELVADRAP